MADETRTKEALIADIRLRIEKMPDVIAVFESVLEHFEHADMTREERAEVIGWLHFAVRLPEMTVLVYQMAQLVLDRRKSASRAGGMRN